MNWLSFKTKFHPSWHVKIKPFIESKECDQIFKALKQKSKDGEKLSPTSYNTFKAFEMPLNNIKVVILGGNPYDGFIDGKPVANGKYLDCSIIEQKSYELMNFYRGLELELFNGLTFNYDLNNYSTQYLQDQGVFMLTSALTIEEHGDHSQLWEPFTDFVMKIIADLDVPVLFLGEQAQRYTDRVDEDLIFTLDEPQGVTETWDTKDVFQKIDTFLEEDKKHMAIMWLSVINPF